jgi:SAM-dependent methyltransferase
MSRNTENWFEDEQLWKKLEPYLFPAAKWEAASEEVEDIIDLVDLPAGASVLDIPCGPGRHAIEFAKRGFDVTGVDLTRHYLDRARERADKEAVDVDFIESDMRDFSRPHSFDVVLNLFSSFGYFDDPADDAVVLERMYENLTPGGAVVFEMVAKEVLLQSFSTKDWHDFEDDAVLLQERTASEDWGAIENRWILIDATGTRTEFRFSHRLYGAAELRKMLERAGFCDTRVFGGLDKAAFTPVGSRLVVVGRRPN